MARKGPHNQMSQFSACGIKIASFSHICQDYASQGSFWHNDERIYYGVVSDGCTQSVGSQFGAKFLCEVFCQEAERLYKEGLREDELLRQLAYSLTANMAAYTPQSDHSGLEQWGGNVICSELYASLLGYIINQDRVLLILAGDGTVAVNGTRQDIDQGGEGALYPTFLLAYPEPEWKDKAHMVYVFASLPTEKVGSIVLATDGLEHMNQFSKTAHDAAGLISEIYREATTDIFPRHRLDDTSVVAISRIGTKVDDPLPDNVAEEICKEAGNASLKAIMLEVGDLQVEEIRCQDTKYCDEHFHSKHDVHQGNNSVLIEVLTNEGKPRGMQKLVNIARRTFNRLCRTRRKSQRLTPVKNKWPGKKSSIL